MAEVGRPKEGLDFGKITFRTSQEQSRIVRQYCRDHEKPVPSEAVRAAIDLLGRSIELSDNIETSVANLLDIAKVFDSINGENAPTYSQAIKEAAALLLIFCYRQHLPSKEELKEQRRKQIDKYVRQNRAQERKKEIGE